MSGRERQRILREEGGTGGRVGETEKQEAAKASKQALDQEQAAEEQGAAQARTPVPDEQADAKLKGRRRRARRARAAAEAGERDPDEGGTAHREQLEREGEEERAAAGAAAADEGSVAVAEAEEQARAEDAEEEAGQEQEVEARRRSRARGRRRAAETTTATPSAASGSSPDGAVAVRARAKYVRCAPRKARLVVDHIRGKSVEEARAILQNTPRGASRDVLKLLESCVANAENNHELAADELRVGQAVVDEGPTIKRYRPRALGRATRINKRTSHMTITLTPR